MAHLVGETRSGWVTALDASLEIPRNVSLACKHWPTPHAPSAVASAARLCPCVLQPTARCWRCTARCFATALSTLLCPASTGAGTVVEAAACGDEAAFA